MADAWGERMPRSVGLLNAVAVSIGITIGSGIFRVPATVAGLLPAPGAFLLCWVLGGALALCGALTVAELAAQEERLVFGRFDNATAWELGLALVTAAQAGNLPVVVSIVRGGQRPRIILTIFRS